jgi:diguanylate cyclase (GGDEF)-like protein
MPGSAVNLVYVVEEDPILRDEITRQIGYFGYVTLGFPDVGIARDAVRMRQPAAMVVSLTAREGFTGMIISEIQTMTDRRVPVIFLAEEDLIELRLRSIRFGGVAFFPRPPDINRIVGALDRVTEVDEPPAYRILIIESDEDLLRHYVKILSDAGMRTYGVFEPMDVLDALAQTDPELILMNLYYDDCLGVELASMIRQNEQYLSVPIVFISRETNRERQLAAMGRGGDDVLVHPIQPQHLISSITARVLRSHALRNVMIRDSLTGLLNHTALHQKLDLECERSRRGGRPCSFIMTDIDKFKRVNDTYGHPAGDQVIKNLARAIKLRLRTGYVAGRHGGEEFGVILPDTTSDQAQAAIRHIQQDFAQIRQRYDHVEFFCTFSAGVASFPEFADAKALRDAADQALYEAKRAGGDAAIIARSDAAPASGPPSAPLPDARTGDAQYPGDAAREGW